MFVTVGKLKFSKFEQIGRKQIHNLFTFTKDILTGKVYCSDLCCAVLNAVLNTIKLNNIDHIQDNIHHINLVIVRDHSFNMFAKFSEKLTFFLPPVMQTCVCVSGRKKYYFFGKFFILNEWSLIVDLNRHLSIEITVTVICFLSYVQNLI